MKRTFTIKLFAVIAAVAVLSFASSAFAYGHGHSGGHGSHSGSYHSGHGSYRGSSYRGSSYHGSSYRGSSYHGSSYHGSHGGLIRFGTWHNTTHLDLHRATIRRHGNHGHYRPAHFDVHRSGHIDW